MTQYPPKDSERDAAGLKPSGVRERAPRALIVGVTPESPADDAGFSPGCFLTSVDGQPLRDMIDWRWLASGDEVEVGYIDLDGDEGTVQLWREPDEEWGFDFDGLVFDGVRQCRNACTFCFMHQLPRGMRSSLYLRDDDFRLSFLIGTFVTCTNMTPEDEARIVEQRISPLRVSLQVSNADVRRRLIGRHAQHGLDAIERLLAKGIEFHAQIVLVPGENDGEVLRETLTWAYERPGILDIGIVPLGYTRHQSRFTRSFNDAGESRALLELIAPFQERAQRERGCAWVFAADEFYRNAWGDELLEHLPSTSFYGDFSMFEDGIGIIRSTVDDWQAAEESGTIARAADTLRASHMPALTVAGRAQRESRMSALMAAGRAQCESHMSVYMVAGFAQREFLDPLIERSGIGDVFRPLYVRNDFFGGNVDVTGLLTGKDIVASIKKIHARGLFSSCMINGATPRTGSESHSDGSKSASNVGKDDQVVFTDGTLAPTNTPQAPDNPFANNPSHPRPLILVPRVIFNDDGLTLDDMTLEDMEREAGAPIRMVSCSPLDYFEEIVAIARAEE